jgi:TRAP-type mannitol/chloroaromatic compound transport system permease large subunit
MIFVIVPIVAPPLVVELGDAQQAAVLLLLVLQLSFLIPPMGYAVMMARVRSGLARVSTAAVVKALLPFILVQCLLTTLVFAVPWMVHQLDTPTPSAENVPAVSMQDIERAMRVMAERGAEDAPSGGSAP